MKLFKKRTPEPLAERLAINMGFQGNLPSFKVVGRSQIDISGCESIVCYEDDIIKLQLNGYCLSVCGSNLTLKTFFGSQVQISGCICQISLGENA